MPQTNNEPILPKHLKNEIALHTITQLNKTYHYNKTNLNKFNYNKLIYFIHQKLNLIAPHTTQQQFNTTTRISQKQLTPNNLIFFHFSNTQISHVNIYTNNNHFVHAPQTNHNIELKNLNNTYYTKHFTNTKQLQHSNI